MKSATSNDRARQATPQANAGDGAKAADSHRPGLEPAPRQPFRVLASRGNERLKVEAFEEAKEVFEALIRDYPDQPEGYAGLARAARGLKDWETAAAGWKECIDKFPDRAQVGWYRQRAEALARLRRFEEAEAVYSSLIRKHPESPRGRVGLAVTAQEMRRWEEALHHWNICMSEFPRHAQPWWHRKKQRVLVELGDIEAAREEAKRIHRSPAAWAYFSMLDGQSKSESEPAANLNYRSILVVTYGRSGSTLLQGILNTIDGVVVRGENQNVFHDFFKIHETLVGLKNKYGNAILPNQAWYGIGFFDESLLLAHFRQTARSLLLADRIDDPRIVCYGFKEIRYDEVSERLTEYLDFLAKVFPDPAFIFNTRNLDDVVESAWWKERDAEAVRAELTALEARFDEYARSRSHCFRISYEAIKEKGERLKEMFDFLGADYRPERIETVLSTPHSYNPTRNAVKRLFEQF